MPLHEGNARAHPIEAPPSSPSPTPAELVARARALHPLIASHAARGEQERRLVQESVDALTDAGMFRMSIPKRYGGYATSLRTMLDVSATVAEADGGTGWVVALSNTTAWMAGLFSEQAQDEVWANNPDARMSGVLTPHAHTVRVDGGFRVTGRWPYNSGSWLCDWASSRFPSRTRRDAWWTRAPR